MTRMRVIGLALAAAGIVAGARDGAGVGEAGLVPFVLPWDGASPYLPEPAAEAIPDAGAGGRVQPGAGGHLYAGGERIRFLKETIGVESVVIGTIVGCGPATLMSELDAVDTHAYWQHPRFPGEPWDPVNWYVDNVSMVNDPGGVLNGLAERRV